MLLQMSLQQGKNNPLRQVLRCVKGAERVGYFFRRKKYPRPLTLRRFCATLWGRGSALCAPPVPLGAEGDNAGGFSFLAFFCHPADGVGKRKRLTPTSAVAASSPSGGQGGTILPRQCGGALRPKRPFLLVLRLATGAKPEGARGKNGRLGTLARTS